MDNYFNNIYIWCCIYICECIKSCSFYKKNWGHERCNPFIIPLAGWINNPNKKTESDFQYTVDNFEFCLGSVVQSVFQFIADSFKFILQGLANLFQDILNILSGINNPFV